jgi:hypothetical protein
LRSFSIIQFIARTHASAAIFACEKIGHPEAQRGICFLRGYIEANHEESRTDRHAFRQGTALAVPQSPETKHGFSP